MSHAGAGGDAPWRGGLGRDRVRPACPSGPSVGPQPPRPSVLSPSSSTLAQGVSETCLSPCSVCPEFLVQQSPPQPPPLGSIFSALGGAESAQGVVPPHLCPQLVPELGDPNRQQSEGHGGGRWGHRGENLLPNSRGRAGRTGVLTAGPCQGHAPRSWTFCLGHGCEARPVRPNSA